MPYNEKEYRQTPKYKRRMGEYYHKLEVKKHRLEYYQRPEIKKGVISYRKYYYLKNKDNPIYKIKRKEYYEKNKDKVKERHYERKDKIRIKLKEWREKNSIKIREYDNKYKKTKREKDEEFNVLTKLRNRVYCALIFYTKTGKIMSSKKYGIDYKSIIENLKPFPKDLSNYEIHHIKPLFTFNFINSDGSTNLEAIKEAFKPENHKLVTKEEHKEIHRKLNSFYMNHLSE